MRGENFFIIGNGCQQRQTRINAGVCYNRLFPQRFVRHLASRRARKQKPPSSERVRESMCTWNDKNNWPATSANSSAGSIRST